MTNELLEKITKQDQLKKPNFKSKGSLYLLRCYNCDPINGKENYSMAIPTGTCAWCGWSNKKDKSDVPK